MLRCCMPETSTDNNDTNFELRPTSIAADLESEYVSHFEPILADPVDGGGGSGRLVSFQSLSNLPNIIFQEKLRCEVSLFYMPAKKSLVEKLIDVKP